MSRAYKNRKKALAKLDRQKIDEIKEILRNGGDPQDLSAEAARARWEVRRES